MMTEYKIARSVKDSASQCFIQSAEQLGLIQGGVLTYSDSLQTEEIKPVDNRTEIISEEDESRVVSQLVKTTSNKVNLESDFITQSLPMASGKVAKLVIPNDADVDSLLLLKDMFDAILRRKFKIDSDGNSSK